MDVVAIYPALPVASWSEYGTNRRTR